MRLADPQSFIPESLAAREREQRNRGLAFAGLTWNLLGCELRQMTPRDRLELQLGGNAFASGLRPLKGDVFQLIWRLSPSFRVSLLSPSVFLAYRQLKQRLRPIPEAFAVRETSAFIAIMLQDLPEASGNSSEISDIGRHLHWMATESLFYMTACGLTFDAYRSTPYLVLQQWHRAWRLSHEDAPQFINESDRLAAAWLRKNTIPQP